MNHTEYVRLRIGVCEDTRLQASTHQPEDMGMQGCKRGHMNLRIWGCKDARNRKLLLINGSKIVYGIGLVLP